jgi:adenylate cyclase
VVSRNTAFTLKGQHVDIGHTAARLGVQYILEGSVRKINDRVRITAQLIDGRTNGHVWAERYDRKFEDIFELQDDISRSIVSALRIRMLPKELETISQKPTVNTDAYRYYLMGRGFFHRGHTKRYLRLAKQMFAKALEIDPDYARAHAGLADCNSHLSTPATAFPSGNLGKANGRRLMHWQRRTPPGPGYTRQATMPRPASKPLTH